MTPLGRLRDWLGGLFGDGGADAADRAVCAVCGTAVEDPDGGCPLCGSHDLERPDGTDGGSGAGRDAGGADGASPTGGGDEDGGDGDGGSAGPERRSVAGTADGDAARLRDLRGGGAEGGTDAADGPTGDRSTGTGEGDG